MKNLVGQISVARCVVEIIVIKNRPETLIIQNEKVKIVENSIERSYSANINKGLELTTTDFVCILNPDIIFLENPEKVFTSLVKKLIESDKISGVSPLILNHDLSYANAARRFPTFVGLIRKCFSVSSFEKLSVDPGVYEPDWIAGMFMLFKTKRLRAINGFCESYRLYYEDVDVCFRLRQRGDFVAVVNKSRVVHIGQRASRRSVKYAYWHLTSLIRFMLFKGVSKIR